jgi:mannose-6-phosphate isomerase
MQQYRLTCCGKVYTSKITMSMSSCPFCGKENPMYEEVDKEERVFYNLGGFSGDKKYEEREWGSFQILADEQGYKVKKITVNPNQRLSLQLHTGRDEYWTIVKGVGWMHVSGNEYDVEVGDVVQIPKYQTHRIENNQPEDLVFIEVQLGDCKEDDIIRIQDDYGRA